MMFWPATVTNVALVSASTDARSKARSGTFTENVESALRAPFSSYFRLSALSDPWAWSSVRLPVTVASTLAMPDTGTSNSLAISSSRGESA